LVLISEGKCILILGAGFGALIAANLLRKNLSISSELVEHQITITDRKDYFMMGLVNLWILNVTRTLDDSKIALNRLENKGISFLDGEITAIDIVSKTVTIRGSSTCELWSMVAFTLAMVEPSQLTAILVLVSRIECVPSLDCVYAALDWISMSLRRMLGAEYYTISAIANLFPTLLP
jgi:hypothetical protein